MKHWVLEKIFKHIPIYIPSVQVSKKWYNHHGMKKKKKGHIFYSVDKINWWNVDNIPLYIFFKKRVFTNNVIWIVKIVISVARTYLKWTMIVTAITNDPRDNPYPMLHINWTDSAYFWKSKQKKKRLIRYIE